MPLIPPPPSPSRRPLQIAGAFLLLGLAALHPRPVVASGVAVDETLSDLEPGTRAPVIVVLSSQADPQGRRGDREALTERMRDVARRTQPAVVRAALGPRTPLAGRTPRRFWLVNAIALQAGPGAIARLSAQPGVAAIVPDPLVRTLDAPTASAAASPSWAMASIGAPRAAATGLTGRGVRIGSIDTGVDASHPQLRGRIVAWRDFAGTSPTPRDDNGHGTHTIGTMVGGAGLGVAPEASVVVARAMGSGGDGRGSAILAAAQWMTDPDGDPATPDQPAVINNSWGTSAGMDTWFRPMVRQWLALGIVPVFAAGNTGPGRGTIVSPADYPESLAVGAVDADGAVAPFSARGPVVWSDPDGQGPAAGTPLTKPDLAAPGVGIVSTAAGGGLVAYSGTSMAAPHVAGAAALIRQAAPNLSAAQVMDVLRRTAADRGAPGPDPDYGNGVLDLPAALAAVGAPVAPAPVPAPVRIPAPPSAAPATPATGAMLARMRHNRRTALAAQARLRGIERRLGHETTHRPRRRLGATVRLRAADVLATRRIAYRVLTRTRALARRLGVRAALRRVAVPRRSGPVAPTPAAVRRNTRFTRLTLGRVLILERAVRRGAGAPGRATLR
jgi:hypothetical protein